MTDISVRPYYDRGRTRLPAYCHRRHWNCNMDAIGSYNRRRENAKAIILPFFVAYLLYFHYDWDYLVRIYLTNSFYVYDEVLRITFPSFFSGNHLKELECLRLLKMNNVIKSLKITLKEFKRVGIFFYFLETSPK